MSLNEQWESLPSMSTQREGCAAAAADGRLFVFGGYDGSLNNLSSAAACDPRTDTWEDIVSMSEERSWCAAAAIGDRLFVCGGQDGDDNALSSAEMYDVRSGTWTSLPPMSTMRSGCAAAAIGDRLFVCGGYDGSHFLSSAEVYDTRTKGWTSIPSMSTKRWGFAAAAVGGRLFVFGGSDGTKRLSTAERYDEDSEGWKTLPPMRTARRCCAAAVVGGQIFVCGGEDGSGNKVSSVEIFDTSLETWSSMASMTTKRYDCAAASLEGRLFAIGGYGLASAEAITVGPPFSQPPPAPGPAVRLCTEELKFNVKVLITREAVSEHRMVVKEETVHKSSQETFKNNKDDISLALSGSTGGSQREAASYGGSVGYGPFAASGNHSNEASSQTSKALAAEFSKAWESTRKVVESNESRETFTSESVTKYHANTTQIFATVTKTMTFGDAISVVVVKQHLDVDDPSTPFEVDRYKKRAWEDIVGVEVPASVAGHTVTIPPTLDQIRNIMESEQPSETAAMEAQTEACRRLRNLAHGDTKNRKVIINSGIIDHILQAMKAECSNSETLQEHACAALGNLAVDSDGRDYIVKLGGIKHISEAMKRHPKSDAVQAQACWALGNLAWHNADNMAAIREAGGKDLIDLAKKEHKTSRKVLRYADGALRRLQA